MGEREKKVSLPVGIPRSFLVKLTRVLERLPVLVHGILPELPTLSPDQVRRVTIIVLRSTRRSTESVKVSTRTVVSLSRTTPLLRPISLTNLSLQWVVSHITVK